MSVYDTLFRSIAMPHVFGFHGALVTYEPSGGVAAAITAVVGAVADDLIEVAGERIKHRYRNVEVRLADVGAPSHPDKITILNEGGEGEVWTVQEVAAVQSGVARLIVSRPERVETGGRRGSGMPGRGGR